MAAAGGLRVVPAALVQAPPRLCHVVVMPPSRGVCLLCRARHLCQGYLRQD